MHLSVAGSQVFGGVFLFVFVFSLLGLCAQQSLEATVLADCH